MNTTEWEINREGDNNLAFQIYSFQFRNTKGQPIEDAEPILWRNNGIFFACVADGITRSELPEGIYPCPSPARYAADVAAQTSSRFLSGALEDILVKDGKKPDWEELLKQSLVEANKAVGKLNQELGLIPGVVDYGVNDYAGTTLTVALIVKEGGNQCLYWATIGDSPILVIDAHGYSLVTSCQTAAKEQFAEELRRNLGFAGIENKEKWRKWYRGNLRNTHYYHQGFDLGFGALTGEDKAEDFIEVGNRNLGVNEAVLVATDGILQVPLEDISSILIAARDPRLILPTIFGKALSINQGQGKTSDDMTAVLIRRQF